MFANRQIFKAWLMALSAFVLGTHGVMAQIGNVSTANVTPSGFSVVWANAPGSTPSISVFADAAGQTNLEGQVGIEYFPLQTGAPVITDSFDRRVGNDALRQQTVNLGLSSVRVTGCNPNTTYYYSLEISNANGKVSFPSSGPLPAVTTAQENAFATQSEELVITLVGATSAGYIVTLSNANTTNILAAVSGDGVASNQVLFSISDLIGPGNTNFVPTGQQQFTATAIGLPSDLGSQAYTVTFPTSFDVNHDDDFDLVLVPPVAQAPTISCPGSIETNAAPCEPGVSVAFSTLVTGYPFPTVTCTLGADVITSPFIFPVGTNVVTCAVTNASGNDSCTFTVTVQPAPSPIPPSVQLGDAENSSANFPVAKLIAQAHDPNGLPLSVSGVVPLSKFGGAVVLANSSISYAPLSGFVGQDEVTYTLTDGCESTQAVINVNVTGPGVSQNTVSIIVSGTTRIVTFAGIPGQSYIIQSAANVSGPWSNLSAPIVANSVGVVQYSDTTSPMPATRFYRTMVSP